MSGRRNYGECYMCCDYYTDPKQAEIYFCPCMYQICAFCRQSCPNCPNCRRPYDENSYVIVENPLFHCTIDQLKDLRIINPRLARITPPLDGRNKEFDQFGKVLSIKNLGNATVILFQYPEHATDCVQTLNQVRIDGVYYQTSFGSVSFCHDFLYGRPCDKVNCYNFHEWDPRMKCFNKQDKSSINHAGACESPAKIREFDAIPPSEARIQAKADQIKGLPDSFKVALSKWAYELLVQ